MLKVNFPTEELGLVCNCVGFNTNCALYISHQCGSVTRIDDEQHWLYEGIDGATTVQQFLQHICRDDEVVLAVYRSQDEFAEHVIIEIS